MPVTIPASYQYETMSGTETYRVYSSKLGDGVEQSTKAGINNIRQEWNVTFIKMTQTEAINLRSLIRAAAGWDIVYWVPPLETNQLKWKIDSHTVNIQNGNIVSIGCKFRQVY